MKYYIVYEQNRLEGQKLHRISTANTKNQAEGIVIAHRLKHRNSTDHIFFYEEIEE